MEQKWEFEEKLRGKLKLLQEMEMEKKMEHNLHFLLKRLSLESKKMEEEPKREK